MFIDTVSSLSFKFYTTIADQSLVIPKYEEFIKAYQDPKEVDKLMKIEQTLNEVNQIVHKSLDDVIESPSPQLASQTR